MFTDIAELRTFVGIVKAGNLSVASRQMGLSLSVVSKRLINLEARTQAHLIARNTRHLALTAEGKLFYEHVRRILAEIDDAEAALCAERNVPQGTLRVSAPVVIGHRHISPVCQEIIEAHPKLSVELKLTDRIVDVIKGGMDVVVRIGAPKEGEVVMRKLSDNYRLIVAAPDYLRRQGVPRHPRDIAQHECLVYRGKLATWRLSHNDGSVAEVRVVPRLQGDNGHLLNDWLLAGYGLAMVSWVDVRHELASGRLVRVLPEWRGEVVPVCALLPQNRRIPPRVRLFLEAIASRMAEACSESVS